jgi:hypothetical protein
MPLEIEPMRRVSILGLGRKKGPLDHLPYPSQAPHRYGNGQSSDRPVWRSTPRMPGTLGPNPQRINIGEKIFAYPMENGVFAASHNFQSQTHFPVIISQNCLF